MPTPFWLGCSPVSSLTTNYPTYRVLIHVYCIHTCINSSFPVLISHGHLDHVYVGTGRGFDDAHFGVADFQMRQAALTQKIHAQGSVSPNGNGCTYTRMSGAGSFCADGKDSDHGLADEQLEAKNRASLAQSSSTDGDTTAGFRYQTLAGEAAHATLPTLNESRSTEDAAEDPSPGRASTTSSVCSFSAPDDLRFSSYRPTSSATPFSAPFLEGPRPRRFRGLQCLERVKQCFMLSD